MFSEQIQISYECPNLSSCSDITCLMSNDFCYKGDIQTSLANMNDFT